MGAVSNFFAAAAALFSFKSKKLDLDNTAEMQARARAKTDQAIKDRARENVAAGNLNQIRKDLAE